MAGIERSGIVTLLTDFGLQDEYVGVMKGVLLRYCPQVRIIDVCHYIPPQNIRHATALLEASYPYFTAGTVHLVVVDPGVGTDRHILVVEAEDHIFIGPDNGVLTPILQVQSLKNCYRLHKPSNNVSNTFHGRDIMAPAAAQIACGLSPSAMGIPVGVNDCVLIASTAATLEDGQICGKITAIDHFGNLITTISVEQLNSLDDDVVVEMGNISIAGVVETYASVAQGKPLALINSRGQLEIAINGGNAADTLAVKPGKTVVVRKM